MARCTLCQKSSVSGNLVSHSQIHTKRKFKPNLQKVNGLILCTKCLKTIKTIQREEQALVKEAEKLASESDENEKTVETVEKIVK